MDVNRLSSISQADTLEKIGEFWDHHDFTEFDTDAPDVEFEIVCDERQKSDHESEDGANL